MIKPRKAGMIAALTCAFGIFAVPFAPPAHASVFQYPWQYPEPQQALQRPNGQFYSPTSRYPVAPGIRPHGPRLVPREQAPVQNRTGH